MKYFAVYGKNISKEFFPFLEKMIRRIREHDVALICEVGFARFLSESYGYEEVFSGFFDKDSIRQKAPELLLSIGGDGTFLDTVQYVKDSGIPVLGVNMGRLGFLANISVTEIDSAVDYICKGGYATEARGLLRLMVDGKDFPGFNHGLNEVSVQKTEKSSLLKIHAYINEIYLTTYWADGVIVSTPTGSTAYSLSGGGPIVSPDCGSFILTPVCPHNLNMRPLVVPEDSRIRLKVEGRSGDFMLSLDSRIEKMEDICGVEISASDFKIYVVKLPGHDYYGTLRDKLGWGEDKRNN